MNTKLVLFFFSFLFVSFASLGAEKTELLATKCVELTHIDNSTKNICEKNNKPFLLLEFFSARCSHCRANVEKYKQLETLTSIYAHSRLISLNPLEEATRFADSNNIETEIALDTARNASRAFGVRSIPALYVLNSSNEIVFTHIGRLNDSIINTIVSLVRQ